MLLEENQPINPKESEVVELEDNRGENEGLRSLAGYLHSDDIR